MGKDGSDLIRLLIAAAALPALAACAGDCGTRLTFLNASGRAIASGTLSVPGGREAATLGNLPSPGRSEYWFKDYGEGAYAIEIRFADGSVHRNASLGYLSPKAGFRDTLMVRPSGEATPLVLKQSLQSCPEGPRMKTLVRQLLKRVF